MKHYNIATVIAARGLLLIVLPFGILVGADVEMLDTTTAIVGSQANLTCPFNDNYDQIIWAKGESFIAKGNGGNARSGYETFENQLWIPDATTGNSDVYTCQTTSGETDTVYKRRLVIAVPPTTPLALSYTAGTIIQPGKITNMTCTSGDSTPPMKIRFYLRRKSSVQYAELTSGVSNTVDVTSPSAKSGSNVGHLQMAFYPEHSDYVFRCGGDLSTLTTFQNTDFTPTVANFNYAQTSSSATTYRPSLPVAATILVFLASFRVC